MPYLRHIFCAAFVVLATYANSHAASKVEELIDQLPEVASAGIGYTGFRTGEEFLPDQQGSNSQMLLLGTDRPEKSQVIEEIVRCGASAIPALLEHLDDSRMTKIPTLKGAMWVKFSDEYDVNLRTRSKPPRREKADERIEDVSHTHKITVGDLCFVELGQIVNRWFNAARYQPTGGLVINSPTESKWLCKIVRADFEKFTQTNHLTQLIEDFRKPDVEDRRIGAYRRLRFYYPEAVQNLVSHQLLTPTYDFITINDFVRNELYPENSRRKRKILIDALIKANGDAWSEGIVQNLFDDLLIQEADEERRLSPPLETKYQARRELTELFGYPSNVTSTNKPFPKYWTTAEKERFEKVISEQKN